MACVCQNVRGSLLLEKNFPVPVCMQQVVGESNLSFVRRSVNIHMIAQATVCTGLGMHRLTAAAPQSHFLAEIHLWFTLEFLLTRGLFVNSLFSHFNTRATLSV